MGLRGIAVLPLISVIIPSYNCARYVGQAIDSVLAQTYKNIEIIVVDDGSKDETEKAVKPYVNRVTYIKKQNGGPASARNVGLTKAKGELIGFLDADDLWLPDKLTRQLKVLQENPRVGLVSCSSYQIDLTGKIIGEYKYVNPTDPQQFCRGFFMRNMVGGGSSSLVRKECFDKLGGFDETLRGTEDWDMWRRIAMVYDVCFVEDFLIHSRIVPNSVSSAANAAKMLENELKLLNKIFTSKTYRPGLILKLRSYSLRYYVAAKGFREAGAHHQALKHILKSFFIFPWKYRKIIHLKILIAIILANLKGKK